MKQLILLIEDETDVMLANQEILESEGYKVLTAETLKEGRKYLKEQSPDLIVLDVVLPDGNGFDFCRQVREVYSVPVLFLTCRDDQRYIIEGLKSGGDDYMTKPYNMEEFLLRCKNILKHAEHSETNVKTNRVQLSSLMLDGTRQKAYLNGADALLTPKEFALLMFFVNNPEKRFTAGELYKAVWGLPHSEDVRTVKAHIYNLRKKLLINKDSEFSITMSDRKYYIWSVK